MSVQERPWAPLATALLFTAWPAVEHARTGSRRALLWGGVLGALFGLSVMGLAVSVGARGPTVWAGHHLWSWVLNPALFAALGVFALRGAESNRVFAAMGERARVQVGVSEPQTAAPEYAEAAGLEVDALFGD